MIEAEKIVKASNRHILYCCYIVAAVYLLVLVFGSGLLGDVFTTALIATSTASVLALMECITVAKLWSWMARSHKNLLATFYMICSGCRIFLVLAVLTAVFFIVGSAKIIPFFVAFVVMYFVLLVYHSWFFTHMSKKIFDEPAITENKE